MKIIFSIMCHKIRVSSILYRIARLFTFSIFYFFLKIWTRLGDMGTSGWGSSKSSLQLIAALVLREAVCWGVLIYSKDRAVQLHFQEEQSVGRRAEGSYIKFLCLRYTNNFVEVTPHDTACTAAVHQFIQSHSATILFVAVVYFLFEAGWLCCSADF